MAINIEVTQDSSFCPGVDRAFKMTEQVLFGGKTLCYSIGPLIHNPEVVKRLGMLGLKVIDPDSEDLPDLAGTNVIIRSHGIDTATEDKLAALGAVLVAATCPTVTLGRIPKQSPRMCLGEPGRRPWSSAWLMIRYRARAARRLHSSRRSSVQNSGGTRRGRSE